MKIQVGLSNHHVHITKETANIIFGENYELTIKRPLKQLGQFASEETVSVVVNNVTFENIRIVGPYRKYNQLELLKKDFKVLNINEVWSDSGKLENTLPFTIIGPKGKVSFNKGAFIARNHIHFSNKDLIKFNVKPTDILTVKSDNGSIINNVVVKSDDTCSLEFHLNKDEGELLNINNFDNVTII